MVYTVKRFDGLIIAVLKSWNGRVISVVDIGGEWGWMLGREIGIVLRWINEQRLTWKVKPNEQGVADFGVGGRRQQGDE